jgi:hypothetical protein
MRHDTMLARKRRLTETITILREESSAVMMDAEALKAESTVMLDTLRRLRAAADLPAPGRRDDRPGVHHDRTVVDEDRTG